eukprot:SAG11_NODE_2557_length_3221_cov_3.516336_1_plen_30_part_10
MIPLHTRFLRPLHFRSAASYSSIVEWNGAL